MSQIWRIFNKLPTINVDRGRSMALQGSYLQFGACYEDRITTIRFSETKSPYF